MHMNARVNAVMKHIFFTTGYPLFSSHPNIQ